MGHFEGDLVLARVGTVARAEIAAVERGGALWRRRVHRSHARNWHLSRRKCWPNACASGWPLTRCWPSITSRAASESPVSLCTASPLKTLFASPMPACTSPSARAEIWFQPRRNSSKARTFARQRQQISAYIEGFLQREHTGPEHLEELTSTLHKLCGGEQDGSNVPVLKEAIESLSRAAESRELHTSGHGDLVARYSRSHCPRTGSLLRGDCRSWSMPPAFTMWVRFLLPERS